MIDAVPAAGRAGPRGPARGPPPHRPGRARPRQPRALRAAARLRHRDRGGRAEEVARRGRGGRPAIACGQTACSSTPSSSRRSPGHGRAAGPPPHRWPARAGGCSGLPSPVPAPVRRVPRRRLHAGARSRPSSRTARCLLGDRAIFKFIRRFEEGINPGVEVGRFLSERARFPYAPLSGGSVEYRPDAAGRAAGDGGRPRGVRLQRGRRLELRGRRPDPRPRGGAGPPPGRRAPPDARRAACSTPRRAASSSRATSSSAPHLEWASLLGRRTAELHLALTSDRRDPDFAPEPLTALDRQALYHGARSLTRRSSTRCAALPVHVAATSSRSWRRENEIIARMRELSMLGIEAERIRCHGDYHLGQVLWTGKDFVIIDFEGEPSSLARPAAAEAPGRGRPGRHDPLVPLRRPDGRPAADPRPRHVDGLGRPDHARAWLTFWHRWVSGTFLDSYLDVAGPAPTSCRPTGTSWRSCSTSSCWRRPIYELGYEANSRPDWVDIPARGILDILDSGAVRSSPPASAALTELAGRYGVQPSFVGTDGREHRAERRGHPRPARRPRGPGRPRARTSPAPWRERRLAEAARRRSSRSLVHRVGRAASAEVTVPERVHPRDVWCTVELEDGEVRRQRLIAAVTDHARHPRARRHARQPVPVRARPRRHRADRSRVPPADGGMARARRPRRC